MGYLYIMTNTRNTVLYVGVTTDLYRRMMEHSEGIGSRFTHKYNCKKLVYYEVFQTIEEALSRETQLKWWRRIWKIQLIEKSNPTWADLGENLFSCPYLRDSGSSPE